MNYICIKSYNNKKCKVFEENKIANGDPTKILERKCILHGGELQTSKKKFKFCKDAPSILNDNNIHILLDRDTIDAIRHDSVNRMVNLLTQSNRIKDLSRSIDYNYEGNTLLHEAIYWNSNKCILYLLKNCTNSLNSENKDGNTVLHIACIKGHSFLINEFYTLGSDISKKNKKGENLLHCAVKSGKLDIVKQVYDMINNPICLKCNNSVGRNVLHTAVVCRNRNLDIIKFLVNEGSDIINIDKNKNTIMKNLNRLEKSSLNIQIRTFLKKAAYDIFKKNPTTTIGGSASSTTIGGSASSTTIGGSASSTTIGGSASSTTSNILKSYNDLISKHPEYAPFVIEDSIGNPITNSYNSEYNKYNVSYTTSPVETTQESIGESLDQFNTPKKILPIKLRPLFDYNTVEGFKNPSTKREPIVVIHKKNELYKEILVICVLFMIVFAFYYE